MRKVLVIEDNEMNREILSDILCEEYDVLEAENGAVGLELFEEHYRELAVILLDLHMPVMDGFEFLEKVGRDGLLSSVPIIVMTADEGADTEERCIQLGALEFLEKPYNPTVMLRRIRNMVHMRETAADIMSIEYDDLTGLYTRQAFYHYAARELADNPDRKYSVFVVDIREFKLINSVYGDATGDEIIRGIAGKLKGDMRSTDGLVGHYGADKFVGMFAADTVPAEDILEDLLKDNQTIAGVENIRIKLGVYRDIDHELEVSRICDRAITALDTVKHSYNQHVGVYDGPLEQRMQREKKMEADFGKAIEDREFIPYFQAKVDPKTGRIVGAEALVRWKRSDGAFNEPYLFIPLFEKDGLVARLDEYMFREVCRMQRARLDDGKGAVPVSINLSRISLLAANTVENYKQIVKEYHVPQELVPIEITESAAFLNEQIANRMREMKEAGFMLHMDDFGSGYSSLTSLGVLPFDVTKLDKSLTDNIETPRGEMIVKHMLAAIRELGMKSVVEGVETAEQVEILKKLGCDAIQGYYYSKPVPPEEFRKMADEGVILR